MMPIYSVTKGNVYIGHICFKGNTCIGHCLENTLGSLPNTWKVYFYAPPVDCSWRLSPCNVVSSEYELPKITLITPQGLPQLGDLLPNLLLIIHLVA